MYDAMTQRRRRRAREELRKFKEGRKRGPQGDSSFWNAWLDVAARSGGDLRDPLAEHPGVFRAVDVIQQSMGSVPWQLWTGATDDDRREVQAGPWYDFFADPNPDYDLSAIWSLTRIGCLLDGDAFWLLRARDGSPLEPRAMPGLIEPIRGTQMTERTLPSGMLGGWDLHVGGSKIRVQRHQVVQFRPIPDPSNPLRGLAPLKPIRRSVRTDTKAGTWTEASLDNGAEPGVVLESTGDGYLTEDQIRMLRQQWVDTHGGAGNARKPAILPGGMKMNTLGWTPRDMEFAEQRRWSRFEIASAYGVPLMLMGDMSEVHSKESARTVLRLFWQNTIKPRLLNEQGALERQLFMAHGDGGTATTMRVWAEPDFSGVEELQADEAERRANAEADRRLGFSLNEINERHGLGYDPDQPAGDVGLVSGGLVPVDAISMIFPDEEPAPEEPEPEEEEEPEEPDDEEETEEEPPESDSESAQEEPEDEPDEADDDDEGRAAPPAIRVISARPGDAERAVLWHKYIRGIQRPGELKMRAAIVGWMRDVRRDTLRFVEQSTRNVRTMTDLELAAFLSTMERRWKAAIVSKTRPATESIVKLSLQSLAAQVGTEMPNVTSPEMLRFMEQQGTRKIRIEETVQTAIRSELLEGIGQRENVTQLQQRVKSVMNVAASRSLTIARTETGSASTGSRFEASKQTGVKRIMWVTARDEAVRESHQALDGVERAFGELYPNGLRYPLDNQSDKPGEVINCRCDWVALRDGIATA